MKVITIDFFNKSIEYPTGLNLKTAKEFIHYSYWAYHRIAKTKKVNIFCMGSSGVILATMLAELILIGFEDCRIITIRKPGERANTENKPTGAYKSEEATNIVIDDFIVSGKTVNTILQSHEIKNREFVLITSDIKLSFDIYKEPEIIITTQNASEKISKLINLPCDQSCTKDSYNWTIRTT